MESNTTIVNELEYKLNTNDFTAELSRALNPPSQVVIPYSIFYKEQEFVVTSTGSMCFCNRSNIESIEFPLNSKIEIIGERSFCNTQIKAVKIPSSVKTIKYRAFFDIKCLKSVEFSENSQLEEIEEEAFKYTAIESFTILPRN